MSRSLQGLHRNVVVIVTALIALLAMHGLSSDHAMGVPGGHMGTAMMAPATSDHADATQRGTTMAVSMVQQMDPAFMVLVSSSSDPTGHVGGMCVGILGVALLLWLLGRALSRHVLSRSMNRARSALALLVRDGPPTARLCPSLVQLCILRT